MADAPSFSTSTRSMPASGMLLMLTPPVPLPLEKGTTRRPLIRTSVRALPKPRSDAPEKPYVELPAALVSWVAFCEEIADTVWINSSVVVTPRTAISSRVMVWTGSAPSTDALGMPVPVTVYVAAIAAPAARSVVPPSAQASAFAIFLRSNFIYDPQGKVMQLPEKLSPSTASTPTLPQPRFGPQ